ncbi:FHA domain-containing protein [Blastopirellula sp. JC732]|uniref:FHA domain-containing protein n=1 Tax=Blastopirellula sediminis TaxID=2894196 RepID=A0A9X1MQD6_9BACT|nr:FHA domain-containing protein [Blastopirellula sediminis]MCC9605719.1 FHA domain-containing protein [Blastopirellula sediminis]MCC9630981.1 FHA domain-containing protein [Blastopirellula sediminis]
MRCALNIYAGPSAGQRIWIGDGQTIKVGRTHASEFLIPNDPHVSGLHFAVELVDDKLMLTDLKSRNGTYVNGERIAQPVALHDGDVVTVGKTHLQAAIPGESSGSRSGFGSRWFDEQTAAANADETGIGQKPPAPRYDSDLTEFLPKLAAEAPAAQAEEEEHHEVGDHYSRLSSGDFQKARQKAGYGSQANVEAPAKRAEQPVVHGAHPAASGAASPGPLDYEAGVAPSGLNYFTQRVVVDPIAVARYIGQGRNLYAIVNLNRLPGDDRSAFYRDATSHGAVPISDNQVVLDDRSVAQFETTIRSIWGRDAVICLASRATKFAFVAHALRVAHKLTYPSELLESLYTKSSQDTADLFQDVSAIMLEVDRGAGWAIFKNDAEIRTWRTLGMPCPPASAEQ